MSNCNRDLCKRHIPVVVNAIKKLDAKQESERQSYVAAFSLTSDDANKPKGIVSRHRQKPPIEGSMAISWEFPQEYASIFQAARTDPNMLLSTSLTVTYVSGGKTLTSEFNTFANSSMNTTGTAPFDAGYYPEHSFIKPLQTQLENDPDNWYKAIMSFINGEDEGYQIYAGAMPYVSTTNTGFRITFFYIDELLNKLNMIPFSPTDDADYIVNVTQWLQNNVKLTRFNVSGIYTPSRLP